MQNWADASRDRVCWACFVLHYACFPGDSGFNWDCPYSCTCSSSKGSQWPACPGTCTVLVPWVRAASLAFPGINTGPFGAAPVVSGDGWVPCRVVKAVGWDSCLVLACATPVWANRVIITIWAVSRVTRAAYCCSTSTVFRVTQEWAND